MRWPRDGARVTHEKVRARILLLLAALIGLPAAAGGLSSPRTVEGSSPESSADRAPERSPDGAIVRSEGSPSHRASARQPQYAVAATVPLLPVPFEAGSALELARASSHRFTRATAFARGPPR